MTTKERPMDHDDLRRAAEGATQGEWTWEPHGDGWALYSGRDDDHHGLNLITVGKHGFDANGKAMRRYIAAAPPATTLALLDENRDLRARAESAEARAAAAAGAEAVRGKLAEGRDDSGGCCGLCNSRRGNAG